MAYMFCLAEFHRRRTNFRLEKKRRTMFIRFSEKFTTQQNPWNIKFMHSHRHVCYIFLYLVKIYFVSIRII